MKRKAGMTAMHSAINAGTDHFLNAGGSPSMHPVTGSALDRRIKKIFELL
jgi:hypothetical protein